MKIIMAILFGFLNSYLPIIAKEDINQNYINVIQDNIEVYNEMKLYDIISIKDAEIISKNYDIDTKKLGQKEYKVYYKKDDKKYVYKFMVNIVDSEPPIVFSGTNKTVNINYKGDLCNLITYGDNYSGNIKCTITGDYDLGKEGKYQLKYELSDSSNNIKKVNVTLNVIKKANNGGSNTDVVKTSFQDVYAKYKNDNNEIGIDVSKWQGDIDFEKVKNAGASFVMIRIGVEGSETRELSLDSFYEENLKKAKEAGLKVGVYLYSIATTKKEALEHANWVLDILDGEKLDLPIVFDWENWTNWNSYKISFYEINDIANTFMSTVKSKGYEGMLYSSKFYLETIWTNKLNFPIWLAHYTSKTNYEGDYQIWQMCNNGQIDGINGDVDIDIMYK